MSLIATSYFRERWEVDKRLMELGLTRSALRKIRAVAVDAALRANPFYPANAAGTFSYQYGTFALRNELVGDAWKVDRFAGVEAIRNDDLKLRIAFSNVDLTCNDDHKPKPRSDKGAGAERATQSAAGRASGGSYPIEQPEDCALALGWALHASVSLSHQNNTPSSIGHTTMPKAAPMMMPETIGRDLMKARIWFTGPLP